MLLIYIQLFVLKGSVFKIWRKKTRWQQANPDFSNLPINYRGYRCQPTSRVQLIILLVISHIDYCNSALARLLVSSLTPLHCVQNVPCQLVISLDRCVHITTALHQLH